MTQMGDNSEINVDYDEAQGLIDGLKDKQKAISEATGSLRSAIKQILDETGYHKSAFASVRAIDAMSETARADYLRTFAPLFDAMMEGKWLQERQDLLDQVEED